MANFKLNQRIKYKVSPQIAYKILQQLELTALENGILRANEKMVDIVNHCDELPQDIRESIAEQGWIGMIKLLDNIKDKNCALNLIKILRKQDEEMTDSEFLISRSTIQFSKILQQ